MIKFLAFLRSTAIASAVRPYRQAFLKVRADQKKGSEDGTDKPDSPSGIRIVRCGEFDVVVRQNTSDEDVLKESFENDIFFAGVPQYAPLEDHVILDVGAHIGTFSLLASSKVPRGRVFAIEASRDTYTMLKINVGLNRRDNITACHIALMGHDGTAKLYHDVGNWGHSAVAALSASSETVCSESLGGFMDRNGIGRCDFMKMNCEGSEFPILLGATSDVLARFSMILVLFHCDLWQANSQRDLVDHLERAGFTVQIRQTSEQRGWLVCSAHRV